MKNSQIFKAFAEVNDIINNSEIAIQEKIPDKFKKMLHENLDVTYKVNIDYTKNINEQQLLPETRDILTLIYKDYLCSEEEREELINKHTELKKSIEEKYNIEKIFTKKESGTINKLVNNENLPIAQEDKKWYQKIFLKIKSFFGL